MRVFVPDATGSIGFVGFVTVYPVVYPGHLSDSARESRKRGERRESPN